MRRRAAAINRRLARAYPDARCELNYSDPLELLVATILSAQCTDVQVNKVTSALFTKYRSAADYAQSQPAALEHDLRAINFFRAKARNIRACMAVLVERHSGKVPDSLAELCALAGVGRKTANVVLGNAFGKGEGVVVDTHVMRLSQRWGLTRQREPEKIERELSALLPRNQWTIFSHRVIWHGRRRCRAIRPDCVGCELLSLCPSGPVFIAKGLVQRTIGPTPRAKVLRAAVAPRGR